MDFRIKYINLKDYSETITRRLIVDIELFNYIDFCKYLKNAFDINETEVIHINWRKNTFLKSQGDWLEFIESNSQIETVVKLNLYSGTLHENVLCDICENVLIGDRYKCLQCDDFDICQTCFQSNLGLHKQHCLIILRKPEDTRKLLYSVPNNIFNDSDFRVLNINLDDLIKKIKAETSTQTENIFQPNTPGTQATDKVIDSLTLTDNNSTNSQSIVDESSECKTENSDSSISKEYFACLPITIREALKTLHGMGFKNIDSALIGLLLENGGDIDKVLEELDQNNKY